MKVISKLLSLLLAVILLLTAYPFKTYAALSTTARDWYYTKSQNHKTPVVSGNIKDMLKKYNAYYVDDTKEKVIYLTFDLGYENGYTDDILDILKEHDIKAAFFVCKAFIDQNPDGLKRMLEEGHVVGNHTVNHISFYKLSQSKLKSELKGVEDTYEKVTGEKMAKILRPPSGGYSEKSLAWTQKLGYKTFFWSIALPNDWNLSNQPTKDAALGLFKGQHHKGAIVLLHGVSPAVAKSLDAMLTQLEDAGYHFGLVTDIPSAAPAKKK
ncbi:polysaccharide deacetylase family protein [Anaerocolumna xylanovorans]|uniref:Peptidoglycan-N-acetylmuramic acid deacetylase n=1 Tax=Anaerocolumna xylanovorans DSM 12503 TaxID=1121345 RepID=A0A1M7YMG6_9FIRM|nr:polysaccharide deacetylase family protein [Anaerocolumna xylanovorans]SHO53800.1 peptidoglycan-N-acetylmuramic acid deacetylase [Anaerocolumna xylanovorans DSM 12503]